MDANNKHNTTTGDDVLIHEETGSGKTLAYLLPVLQGLDLSVPRQVRRRRRTTTSISRFSPSRPPVPFPSIPLFVR